MKTRWIALFPVVAVLLTACTTTESQRAKPLRAESPPVDLSGYRTATVVPFQTSATLQGDPSVANHFANNLATRLKNDFGPLFEQVNVGTPKGSSDELIITGVIDKYRPGSRTTRFFFPGFGSSSFEGTMVLKDGANQEVLLRAPFDKLWAWGGGPGAFKDIEDMLDETAAAAASTIAHAKGWRRQ